MKAARRRSLCFWLKKEGGNGRLHGGPGESVYPSPSVSLSGQELECWSEESQEVFSHLPPPPFFFVFPFCSEHKTDLSCAVCEPLWGRAEDVCRFVARSVVSTQNRRCVDYLFSSKTIERRGKTKGGTEMGSQRGRYRAIFHFELATCC